jgi:tetratricopeptide (TPR) repeat protein
MNDSSIQHISDLLDRPETIIGSDHVISLFRQTYPYFVPVRYIKALESHKKNPLDPITLSAIRPYMGNWMLFCNFLKRGTGESSSTENIEAPQHLDTFPEEQLILKAEPELIATEEMPLPEQIEEKSEMDKEEELITPIYTSDYFLQQGEKVSEDIPSEITDIKKNDDTDDEDKSLMVMMSFSEWLLHFKNTSERQQEEKKEQKALKTMWQKEKLAAAIEEENDEIPENVFEMAVNSIAKEDGLARESLADIYIKQGKYEKAIEMYRKLSLRNPQKSAYFARKIEEVLKEKQS